LVNQCGDLLAVGAERRTGKAHKALTCLVEDALARARAGVVQRHALFRDQCQLPTAGTESGPAAQTIKLVEGRALRHLPEDNPVPGGGQQLAAVNEGKPVNRLAAKWLEAGKILSGGKVPQVKSCWGVDLAQGKPIAVGADFRPDRLAAGI